MPFLRSACLARMVVLTSVVLTASGARAEARSTPLGVIAEAAGVDGKIDLRIEGTSVYDGDTLPLGGESRLVVEIGKSTMYLQANPSVLLHRLSRGFSVNLKSGTLRIRAGQDEIFEIIANGIKFAPRRDVPASITIKWVSNTALDVDVERGALRVSMGEQTNTLEERHSYRVQLLPDALPGAATAGKKPKAPGRSWFTTTMISAVTLGTGIAVWRALVSPCHLKFNYEARATRPTKSTRKEEPTTSSNQPERDSGLSLLNRKVTYQTERHQLIALSKVTNEPFPIRYGAERRTISANDRQPILFLQQPDPARPLKVVAACGWVRSVHWPR